MINLVFEDLDNLRNCFDESEVFLEKEVYRITTSQYVNNLKMISVYQKALEFKEKDNITFDNENYKINFLSTDDVVDGKYIIPIGVNQSPKDWMSDFYTPDPHNFKNIFDKLSDKYLGDLQNGKAFLMIDNTLEGYHSNDIFEYLYLSAVLRHISPKQIIYVTGNLNIEENLENWCSENKGKEPIMAIPYAHFEYDIGSKFHLITRHNNGILPTTYNHMTHKESLGPHGVKIYNFLNKKPRKHRTWMYGALHSWNLLDKGVITMNPSDSIDIEIDYNKLSEDTIIECNSKLPVYAYDDDVNDKEFDYYMYNFNQQASLDSWITIVSETHFEDKQETCFLSEKTFKAIACQNPFLILGNRGSLKKLHDMGYKTFDHIIDEGYDDLESIHRINAIVDILRHWESNPNKLQQYKWFSPILEHNVEVLKYNAMFNPPAKFHKLVEILK